MKDLQTKLDYDSVYTLLQNEIFPAINRGRTCSLYIAESRGTEIFANDKSIFWGNLNNCKKMFKELLKRLKKSDYILDGDFKELIYIAQKR